jgi:hypothetical protein
MGQKVIKQKCGSAITQKQQSFRPFNGLEDKCHFDGKASMLNVLHTCDGYQRLIESSGPRMLMIH